MKTCLFLLFLLSTLISADTNNTITVSSYSAAIASLPHTNFKFIDNGIINVIERLVPDDVHVDVNALVTQLSATFYVFLFIVLFTLVILSIFVVSSLQCFCNLCGSAQVQYSSCQRGSAYAVNFVLLFTVAVAASLSIYFFLNSTAAAKGNLDEIRTEVHRIHGITDSISKDSQTLIDLDVYNFSLPDTMNEVFNSTANMDNAFQNPSIDKTFSFNWIIIVSLIFLVVLAVGAAVSAYFRVRIVYIILGYLFFLSFLILSVSAIGSVSFGAFLSNFCASGIDSNMKVVINAFHSANDTCTDEVVKTLLFCETSNSTCQPFSNSLTIIEEGISEVEEKMKNNSDPRLKSALVLLESMKGNVTVLSDCSATSSFYIELTNEICFNSVGSLVNLSTALELISLLIFLFLLCALYTWHRITTTRMMGQAYDYESIPQRNQRSELNPIGPPDSDCSTGCFLHVVLMVVFWGAFTFGAFVVLSFGGAETEVPRN